MHMLSLRKKKKVNDNCVCVLDEKWCNVLVGDPFNHQGPKPRKCSVRSANICNKSRKNLIQLSKKMFYLIISTWYSANRAVGFRPQVLEFDGKEEDN